MADRIIIFKRRGSTRGLYFAGISVDSGGGKSKSDYGLLAWVSSADIEPASLHSGQGIWKLNHFHFAYKKQPETLSLENIEASCRKCNGGHRAQWSPKRHYPVAYADWKKDVKVSSKEWTSYSSKQRLKLCYMVMQDVKSSAFYGERYRGSPVKYAGKYSDESPENVAKAEAILTEMDLLPYKACHPMGLSGGQKTMCGDCFCDCL